MAIRECIPRLIAAGISADDAHDLRRIAMTLRNWFELECGSDRGAIEREEKWAIERAAWKASDPVRWWNGSTWARKKDRRTYDDYAKAEATATLPADAAWRETGSKPYWRDANGNGRTLVADREKGAERQLAAILKRYPTLQAYIQGDCRGASLYIIRPGDIRENCTVDSSYSNGIAVYK